jgi:hypothetical protein
VLRAWTAIEAFLTKNGLTTMHPTTGLMRAVWVPKEVAGEHWVFAEGDALALRQACRLRAGLARSTW